MLFDIQKLLGTTYGFVSVISLTHPFYWVICMTNIESVIPLLLCFGMRRITILLTE